MFILKNGTPVVLGMVLDIRETKKKYQHYFILLQAILRPKLADKNNSIG